MKKSSGFRSHSADASPRLVKPRKTPVQARSAETVRAIREATIQVLLETGAQRLTTTRVSQRAGVSVGTLYQYFPNKNALLYAVLNEHFSRIIDALEQACAASHGCSVEQMARTMTLAFIDAKLHDAQAILVDVRKRGTAAIIKMLRSAPGARFPDVETTVMVLYTALAATMRVVLESGASKAMVAATRRELVLLAEGQLTRASLAQRG
jgi:AcrR family transcriptional regulator